MTKEEQDIEHKLKKERLNLIMVSGIERSLIRIFSNSVVVKKERHGSIVNHSFVLVANTEPSESNPESSSITNLNSGNSHTF